MVPCKNIVGNLTAARMGWPPTHSKFENNLMLRKTWASRMIAFPLIGDTPLMHRACVLSLQMTVQPDTSLNSKLHHAFRPWKSHFLQRRCDTWQRVRPLHLGNLAPTLLRLSMRSSRTSMRQGARKSFRSGSVRRKRLQSSSPCRWLITTSWCCSRTIVEIAKRSRGLRLCGAACIECN